MNWQKEYKEKLKSAEDAVKEIKNGDRVYFAFPRQPFSLTKALEARRDELEEVEVLLEAPRVDNLWVAPNKKESFKLVVTIHPGPKMRPWLKKKRTTYLPTVFSIEAKTLRERTGTRDIDVYLGVISPPDKNGFCSFGPELWNKKNCVKSAKKVIAEVDNSFIRTYGDNFIHVSQIDHLVEYTPEQLSDEQFEQYLMSWPEEKKSIMRQVFNTLAPNQRAEHMMSVIKAGYDEKYLKFYLDAFGFGEPSDEVKMICEYLKPLIHNGDCLQVGVAGISGWVPNLNVLNDKLDLGYHGEQASRGIGTLIKNGVINGKKKTFHPGKAVFTSLSGFSGEEIQFAHNNPNIELYPAEYIVNIGNISKNDNQVAINTILAIDLTGQINAESISGGMIIAGAGGQTESHIGAVMSRGGRAFSLLRSTASTDKGLVSRIVPKFQSGEIITIPNIFSDHVITEYGVAALMGKSHRERAAALIAIAHPDFRSELKKEAKKMFGPL